jgi:Flp pilus assembly protein TadG
VEVVVRSRRQRDGQRGAAAVEFALVLPILLTLTMGAIDWGYYFFVDQMVTNAAREGARAGSVVDPAKSWATAQAAAEGAANAYLVKCQLTGTASVVASPDNIGGTPAVSVTIQYPAGSLSGLLKGLIPTNAIGRAVMRWQ